MRRGEVGKKTPKMRYSLITLFRTPCIWLGSCDTAVDITTCGIIELPVKRFQFHPAKFDGGTKYSLMWSVLCLFFCIYMRLYFQGLTPSVFTALLLTEATLRKTQPYKPKPLSHLLDFWNRWLSPFLIKLSRVCLTQQVRLSMSIFCQVKQSMPIFHQVKQCMQIICQIKQHVKILLKTQFYFLVFIRIRWIGTSSHP